MEVEIDFTKSAQENANDYFVQAKRAKHKAEGARETVKGMEQQLSDAKKELDKSADKKQTKSIAAREWYEKFHWFNTGAGFLAIGGRDASQNELLNAKYFDDNDLFFHADIFGASVVILKDGVNADATSKVQAAQFAACFSSAWKEGQASVNVYMLTRKQVSKSTAKGSLGKGSFAISGTREWFRNQPLALVAYVEEKEENGIQAMIFRIAPASYSIQQGVSYVEISEGKSKKSDAAKGVSKMLNYPDIDYIMQQLPTGYFSLKHVLNSKQ